MDPAARALADALSALGSPERAAGSARFFKTGPGEYGEGDRFLGVTMPELRRVVRGFRELPAAGVDDLLASEWHEHRMAALLILVERYRRGDAAVRAEVYAHYLRSTARINNWDLVDASAEFVVGPHLDVVGEGVLDELVVSDSLWERRIAMLATFHRIKRGEPATALRIAERLLGDDEPLIHKAVGWMLREVGKRCDEAALLAFLDAHTPGMPAVMLSYATERLTPEQRLHYRALRTGR